MADKEPLAQSKFRHEQVYRGDDYVERLNLTKLVVCGAGALGSNLVDVLTRQGCSSLAVVDKDRVESHNIGTQIYGEQDVGAQKAQVLKNRVFRQTGLEIEGLALELTENNVKKLLGKAALVIDAFDNRRSRQLVQDFCRKQRINCLHAGLFSDYGEVIWDQKYRVPKDMIEGDVCDYPLARNLITIVVAVLAEEILDFCLAQHPRLSNWSITLKDLSIERLRL